RPPDAAGDDRPTTNDQRPTANREPSTENHPGEWSICNLQSAICNRVAGRCRLRRLVPRAAVAGRTGRAGAGRAVLPAGARGRALDAAAARGRRGLEPTI